jgi:hypothetical protein
VRLTRLHPATETPLSAVPAGGGVTRPKRRSASSWTALRGEISIAELCRREGIAEGLYYSWSKEFLEAGKRRLAIAPCLLWRNPLK